MGSGGLDISPHDDDRPGMQLTLARLGVRSLRLDDAARLAKFANNREIWRNLRDRFPHPYARKDADEYLARALGREPQLNFAITLNDEFIGSIGIIPGEDIYRRSAEFGYWLGEPYWGGGYATEAVRGFTDWAFGAFDLVRLYAMVFVYNPASARVLEKAGFTREATSRAAAIKDGQVWDEWLYAKVRL